MPLMMPALSAKRRSSDRHRTYATALGTVPPRVIDPEEDEAVACAEFVRTVVEDELRGSRRSRNRSRACRCGGTAPLCRSRDPDRRSRTEPRRSPRRNDVGIPSSARSGPKSRSSMTPTCRRGSPLLRVVARDLPWDRAIFHPTRESFHRSGRQGADYPHGLVAIAGTPWTTEAWRDDGPATNDHRYALAWSS